MRYAIVSQDAEEEHGWEKFHIQSGTLFDEDFFKDIEAEVVDEMPYNIHSTLPITKSPLMKNWL